jgi:glycerol-3-phosphate dehydrogenase
VTVVAINPGTDGTHTIVARDEESGEVFEIRTRAIINATGVWTAESQAMLGGRSGLAVTMSKGVHIVVDRDRFRSAIGLLLRAGASVLFVIPWGRYWIIGTTDTPWDLDKSNPVATSQDIDYLLAQVNVVLETPITRADIRGVWAGLRPLVKGKAGSTAKLSREHVVDVPQEGIAVIAGGKLTTYRVMARHAVDAATKGRVNAAPSRTHEVPLVGARELGGTQHIVSEMLAAFGLDESQGERLIGRYGDRLDEVLRPIRANPSLREPITNGGGAILAEALYAVTHEGALHLEDVLERRLRVAMESTDFGLGAAPEVAAVMAGQLGWSLSRVRDEIDNYSDFVAQQRAAMALPDDASADARMRNVVPVVRAVRQTTAI